MDNRKLDQFYTSSHIAEYFYNILKNKINLNEYTLFLEPSAGVGAFYDLMPNEKRIGIDISSPRTDFVSVDFLNYIPDFLDERVIVVGNPPFGKNSNLAVKFFNKSAEFSEVISFILPKTFRKASIVNRLNLNFHLLYDEDCPKNSFVFDGYPYDVPCCFQIWIKQPTCRPKINIVKSHTDFKLVAKTEDPDFAVQRIGNNAGRFRTRDVMMDYSDQSHYFIKSLTDQNIIENIFKTIDYTTVKYNTAGNPSVSPSELYQLYEQQKVKLYGTTKI